MAVVNYSVCDRCGEKIEYKGKTIKIFKRPVRTSKFKFLSIFNGNPSGYDYSEQYVELCGNCTRKLDIFLNK